MAQAVAAQRDVSAGGAEAPPRAVAVPGAGGRRLDGVDGLRAVAALWVVAFHMRAFSGAHLGPLDLVVRSGSTGVSLFLVLSGFCLYVPVARRGTASFRARAFFVRRARRLMPAYYASLGAVVLATVVAAGRLGFGTYDAPGLVGQIAAHLSMTHSLFPATFYALNGAYWSLALEWQLYLTLPLLVIGVRRFGMARTVGAVVGVNIVYRLGLQLLISLHAVTDGSLAATAVLPNLLPGRWAEFAFGMLAADLYASGRVAEWARWLQVTVLPTGLLALLVVGSPLAHLLFGSVFFSLLCVVLTRGTVFEQIFSWRPLAALGVMSYSLYLVHQPIVQALAVYLGDRGASPTKIFAEEVILLPFILAAAWVLFVTVERWTLHTGAHREATGPEAVLLAPLAAIRRSLAPRSRPHPASDAAEAAAPVTTVPAGEP